ncbi:MAG: ABC transporter substrate-binding protein [Actinobacteria bacterium]|nr:ABC transporter substrate-binding protein [Actinomycetota bacterium]
MKKRPLLATAVIAALALAACGGSDTAAPDTTAAAATGVDLVAAGCPATVSIQTDWNPEAEHGNLYQLVGPGYTVDKAKLRVTGDLMAGGKTTGVKVEIRAGGPAIGYSQVTAELYKDPSILLGFTSTDEAVAHSTDFPTQAVVAPFNINPQIIMWDPGTYPNVKTIADLKATGAKVRYFDGAAYMDYFTSTGILDKKQVDGTYDGAPASFIAAGGKDTQQGFGTAEPYAYKNLFKDWMKDVAYQYIHDAGWTAYAQSLGGTPANIAKYDTCLKALVPVIQQAAVDYVAAPDTANAIIVDAVTQYNNGWTYDAGQGKAAVAKMQEDKLIANSPDGTLGSFDMDRITAFITTATPVFTSTGAKVKDGLVAEDIVTNKYINPAIKLG